MSEIENGTLNFNIPAYTGEEPYIFIGYAHLDKEEVYKVIGWLDQNSYRFWYDEGIEFGENFPGEIAVSIKNCDCFVVFISNVSITRDFVIREILYAKKCGKKIVPVYLESTELSPELDFTIGFLQGIEKFRLIWDVFCRYLEKGLPDKCRKKNRAIPKKIAASSPDRQEQPIEPGREPERISGGKAESGKTAYVFPQPGLLMQSPGVGDVQYASVAENLSSALNCLDIKAEITNAFADSEHAGFEMCPAGKDTLDKTLLILSERMDYLEKYLGMGVKVVPPSDAGNSFVIKIPNSGKTVLTRDIITSGTFREQPSKLAITIGMSLWMHDIIVADLVKMPHMLVAGSTGSGRNMFINSMIISLLYRASPDEVKLLLIDPTATKLGVYDGLPHLLAPAVTDPRKALKALNWAVQEMTVRYKLFAEYAVRDIRGYNKLTEKTKQQTSLPIIVIIVGELAELMEASRKDAEDAICRLAQMARAAGIHLVLATQRAVPGIVTKQIKANIPTRIAFALPSVKESKCILDMPGAEKLLGHGHLLYNPLGEYQPRNIQGPYISDQDVERVVEFIKTQEGSHYSKDLVNAMNLTWDEEKNDDDKSDDGGSLLPLAAELVLESGNAAISYLQRRLNIGSAKASRIMEQLEAIGVVGEPSGTKPRKVLITREQWMKMKEENTERNKL